MKSLSRVRLFSTPWTVVYQALPSMGFSRQECWSGLPFPSPMHESENWKWSHSVVSDSLRPHGPQSARFLCPCNFSGKNTGIRCLPSSRESSWPRDWTHVYYVSCIGRWVFLEISSFISLLWGKHFILNLITRAPNPPRARESWWWVQRMAQEPSVPFGLNWELISMRKNGPGSGVSS